MWKEHPGFLSDSDDEVANRQTASLTGLAITLLLAVIGLFLMHGLQAANSIGDRFDTIQMNCDLSAGIGPPPSPLTKRRPLS